MKFNLLLLLGVIFLMASCYPEEPVIYEDLDLVYTNYSETFDFSSKGTYALPDKIVKVTGNLTEGQDPEFIKEPYNSQILDQIESNMSALGWVKVDDPENADLTFMTAVWSNTTVTYWYDYWCWYSYYYCGWGYYYPTYVTSYTTGTLVMALVAAGEDYIEPYIVWTGIGNGVASGSADIQRVNKAIDQAFKQSPYLNAN